MKANRKKDTRKGLEKWQNKSAGTHRIWINEKLTIIKPNEKFKALKEEVPTAFRDIFVCLSGVVDGPTITSKDGVDLPKWELKEVDGGFNVYDPVTKKTANTAPLEKEEAEKLLEEKKKEAEAKK